MNVSIWASGLTRIYSHTRISNKWSHLFLTLSLKIQDHGAARRRIDRRAKKSARTTGPKWKEDAIVRARAAEQITSRQDACIHGMIVSCVDGYRLFVVHILVQKLGNLSVNDILQSLVFFCRQKTRVMSAPACFKKMKLRNKMSAKRIRLSLKSSKMTTSCLQIVPRLRPLSRPTVPINTIRVGM